jgi:hypothetical protein
MHVERDSRALSPSRFFMRTEYAGRFIITSVTAAWVFLLVSGSSRAAQTVYSLNGDWSDTANPNGAWSYNNNETPISVHQTFWWGQPGWGYNSLSDGGILRGTNATGMTDPWGDVVPPAHDWVPDDVMLHALSVPYGGDSTFLNVTWTSPTNGFINIAGRAWDGQIYADRDLRWTLGVGGEIYAQRFSVVGLYRTNSGAQFSSNLVGSHTLTGIPVTEGEVVEFRVAAQTYYGQHLGLDMTVTFVAPTVANPVLSIAPLSALAFTNLSLGGVYRLQRWLASSWSNQPVSFTASSMLCTQMVPGMARAGEYRLALTPAPAQAFAIPQVVHGFIWGATVTSGGSGYVDAPAVTFVGGSGTNAAAVAQISGGVVTNIAITGMGAGYEDPPTIFIAPPPDGTASPAAILPAMRVESASLTLWRTYQLQFKPQIGGSWVNWEGGSFTASQATNSQSLLITHGAGFFRLREMP